MFCPKCKANLAGDLIYNTMLEQYGTAKEALKAARLYGATKTKGRWSRKIGIYDEAQDRTVAYRCPDCNHEWSR